MGSRRKPLGLTADELIGAPVSLALDAVTAWLVARHLHGGWLMILVCLLTAGLVGCLPFTLAHELGHAVTARAVGLPVTDISVLAGPATPVHTWAGTKVRLGLSGPLNGVRVDGLAQRRLLALRYVLTLLGGPAATLILAGVTGVAYRWLALPTLARAAVLMTAAAGVVRASASLVPVRRRLAASSDGWQVLAWTFRPRRTTTRTRDLALLRGQNSARKAGQPVDRPVLVALLDSPDSMVAAMAAIELLLAADTPAARAQLVSDRGRLAEIVRADGLPRPVVTALIGLLLNALIEDSFDSPDPEHVADGIALAEFGRQRMPYGDQHCTALALLQVWQGRPVSARHLLRNTHLIRAKSARATALAVQAWAEAELGQLDQARQLAAQATETDPTAKWVTQITTRVVERTAAE